MLEVLCDGATAHNQAVQQAGRHGQILLRGWCILGTKERVAAASDSGYSATGVSAHAIAGTPPGRSDVLLGHDRGKRPAQLAFPLAAICALVFRFPLPFNGYASGPAALPRALVAVVFYSILGGFPVLLVADALGGAAANALGRPAVGRIRRLTLAFAGLIALLGVLLLAVLDTLIGPW